MSQPESPRRRRLIQGMAAVAVGSLVGVDPVGLDYPLTPRNDLSLNETTVVLVHGLGGDPDSAWIPGAGDFLFKKGAKRVLRLRLPLDGQIVMNQARVAMDNQLSDLEGAVVMVGWSGGGRMCLDWLNRVSTPVQGLVLVETRMPGVGGIFAKADHRYELYKDPLDGSNIRNNIEGNAVIIQSANDALVPPDNAYPLARMVRGHVHDIGYQNHAEDPKLAEYFGRIVLSEVIQGVHITDKPAS